jgi:hypothetical protein
MLTMPVLKRLPPAALLIAFALAAPSWAMEKDKDACNEHSQPKCIEEEDEAKAAIHDFASDADEPKALGPEEHATVVKQPEKVSAQPATSVDVLIGVALKSKRFLVKKAMDVAREAKCEAVVGKNKKKERVEEKAKLDYADSKGHPDYSRVLDYARAKIVCPDYCKVKKARSLVEQHGFMVKREKDLFKKELPHGYRGINLNAVVDDSNLIVELQIVHHDLDDELYAATHKIYERYRVLKKTDPDYLKEQKELRAIYDAAWHKIQAKPAEKDCFK